MQPAGTYDGKTLFWRHERLQRSILADYPARIAYVAEERDGIEQEFVADCFARAAAAEEGWLAQVLQVAARRRNGPLYDRAWAGFNHAAAMPVVEA